MYSIKELQNIISDKIASLNIIKEPVDLYEPIDYIISIGGKRLRPVFVLLAYNIFSNNIKKAFNPALGIEIFHNFTLMHDDIMDKSLVRRNFTTVHEKWNTNVAILSGDAMSIKAYEYMIACEPGKIKTVLDIFNKTALEVCEGQQYDLNFENAENVSIEEYLRMIELKTAVLIASSFKIGAVLGGADDNNSKLLFEFGKNVGLAFQLQDDLLDVFGNPKLFGKNIGGDIVTNKKPYLLIKAFEIAKANVLEELKENISAVDFIPERKIEIIKSIFEQLEIKRITEEKIKEYFELAGECLESLAVEENKKKEIKKLIPVLINRLN